MRIFSTKKIAAGVFLATLIAQFSLLPFVVPQAQAVNAGNTYMRCDRMKAATAPGSCLVVFTTSATVFAEAYIKVTLDTEWVSATNFTTTAANYTVSTAGIPAGTTAMPGVATADNVTGQTIRFPVTALANSTTYAFFITGTGLALNPAASTTIAHTIFSRDSGDTTTGDTKDIAVPTISNDQIVVSASVNPTFTFVFGNNAQTISTITTATIGSGTGTAITITTNAPGGWNAWVKSTNTGLVSTLGSHTIPTVGTIDGAPNTLSAGTEGYVLDADLTTDAGSGGTVTLAGEYNGTTTSQGGTLSTTLQSFASANGTANGDVITLIPRAAGSGITTAATDYTDTLTVVGAGIF